MCSNEAECSNMENENQEKCSPEELFAEILNSPSEYTTEKTEILLSNKSKLLSILKTRRPIKISNYFYGLSQNLGCNKRLIVFEWDDKRKIREYTRDLRNSWECLSCHLQYYHQLRPTRCFLYLVNGIVFVAFNHDCPPRDYELVLQYQKFLEEGNTRKARSMAQTVDFTFGSSSLSNVVNAVSMPTNSTCTGNEKLCRNNKIVAKTSASLTRKSNDNGFISSAENPSVKMTKNNKATIEKTDFGVNQKYTGVVKHKEAVDLFPIAAYSFEMPSTSELKRICNKLDIKYCKEANGFWKEITFKKIDISSKNVKTLKFKTKNFYKILSNFFTGKFCDYGQIYYAINCAFRDKLVADGEMSFDDIDLLCSSYTVTKMHLKFIATFIPCKILIFDRDEDKVTKYGKWKNTNHRNILTLVMSFSKRKYSVVVSL